MRQQGQRINPHLSAIQLITMTIKKFIFFSSVTCALISCDPAHSLIVSNTSSQDKMIQVFFPNETKNIFGLTDSIRFVNNYQLEGQPNASIAKTTLLDSLTRSYSFILPLGQDVILERGWGSAPLPNQKIIIDNTDTVVVSKKSSRITKRPKLTLGGDYRLTIKD